MYALFFFPPPSSSLYVSHIDALTLRHFHGLRFPPHTALPRLLLATLATFCHRSGYTLRVSSVTTVRIPPLYAPNAHRPSRFNTSGSAPPADRCVAPPILRECSAYSSACTPATDTTCRNAFTACARVHIDRLSLPQPNATSGADGGRNK